ncbi:MAG: hypothetical protein HQL11_00225 [Candidatus Omnitrophica bacterium]|nr:hypothetical protein [Candidatus Omnitrophota bacterium]
MSSSDLTPEERLFNIIRSGPEEKSSQEPESVPAGIAQDPGSGEAGETPDGEGAGQAAEGGAGFLGRAVGGVSGLWARLRETLRRARAQIRSGTAGAFGVRTFSPQRRSAVRRALAVRNINAFLVVVLLAVTTYFVAEVFVMKATPEDRFVSRISTQIKAPSVLDVPRDLFDLVDIEENGDVFAERNIFQPWTPKAIVAGENTAESEPSARLSQVAGKLRLTGIYLSDHPEALIEDIEEQRTYTVGVGGLVKGIKIVKIEANGVVISDGNAELRLE